MAKQSFYQIMEDNWPEDEAVSLAMDIKEDGHFTADQIARQVAHMHKVFNSEADGAQLIARFDAKLAASLA